ncbi:MAG: recombinase family protein [Deltaproteobacteria bacterium]|nr:recombinase family protein [Deltaproteobacteria bacterium]
MTQFMTQRWSFQQAQPPSTVFEDKAKSGKSTTGRVGLERLLAAAATPAPGVRRVLVVEAIDRLGRNLFDGMDTVRRLHRDAGFRIITADGRDSDNPAFKAMLMADTFAADAYLDNLKLHTRRGLEGRVLSAGVWIGRAPVGYHIKKTTVEGASTDTGKHVIGGHLVVDDVGASKVRRAFELAAEGLPLHAVARKLNQTGVPSHKGVGWTGRTLRSILRKPLYRGDRTFRGKVVVHDEKLRIVPDDLWNRVQEKIATRTAAYLALRSRRKRAAVGGASTGRHLLTGFFRCSVCGSSISGVGRGGNNGARYGCPARCAKGTCSNGVTMNAAGVEKAVVREVLALLLDPQAVDHLVAAVESRVSASDRGRAENIARARRSLTDIDRRLRACVEQIEKHGPSEVIGERIAALEAEKRTATEALAKLEATGPRVTVLRPVVESWLKRAAERLTLDADRARAVLRELIAHGVATPVGRGRYELRFEVLPLGVMAEIGVPDGRSSDLLSPSAKGGS